MPQTLYVKTPGGGTRPVRILRSWSDASGLQLFLHGNGTYGYINEAPVRKENEFDIIGDPRQRMLALAWWNRTGRKLSEAHYAEIEESLQETTGDFRTEPAQQESDLDGILYIRRATGKKKKGGAVTAPHSWMEWFPKRPDWWGQAKRVDFPDYAYEMVEPGEVAETDLEETEAHTVGAPGTPNEAPIDDSLKDPPPPKGPGLTYGGMGAVAPDPAGGTGGF